MNVRALLMSAALFLVPAVPVAAELKIAVLNAQAAVANSNAFKAATDAFKRQYASDIKQLETLQTELKALDERRNRDSQVMSDADRRKLENDLRDKQNNLQFLGNKLQGAQNDKMQEVLQQLQPQLEEAVKSIVQADNIDLVLQAQAIGYVRSDMDITKRVAEKLNESKAAAPKP